MLLCSNCETENQQDSKFCQNCGNSLIIQSSLTEVQSKEDIGSQPISIASREERFRKAKIAALKAIKNVGKSTENSASNVVYLGEKIL